MAAINHDYLFQMLILGDSGVGKSNISSRFRENLFDIESNATTGAEVGSRYVRVDKKIIKAVLWDIAGEDRHRRVMDYYYEGAKGALIVYDITSNTTFENVEWWLNKIRSCCNDPKNVVIMLVGNKSDIAHRRQVSTEEAKSFAEREKLLFIETSALSATNVVEGFKNVLTQIYNNVTSP